MINTQKFVAGLHEYIARAFAPVNTEMAAMRKRLDAMEKSVADFSYKGVWEHGKSYVARNCVTSNGAMWVCIVERTVQKPGDGSDWKLAVQRGRDAR